MRANPTSGHQKRMPVFSPRTVLQLRWERAAHHLTPQELKWLADEAAHFVMCFAINEENMLSGLGCIISADSQGGSSGAFRCGGDLPSLLFVQAEKSSLIAGLTHIASEAAGMAAWPKPGAADKGARHD